MTAADRTPTTIVTTQVFELPDRPLDLTAPTGAQRLERAQWAMARRVVIAFAVANVAAIGTFMSAWFWFAYVAIAVSGWFWAWAPIRAYYRRARSS